MNIADHNKSQSDFLASLDNSDRHLASTSPWGPGPDECEHEGSVANRETQTYQCEACGEDTAPYLPCPRTGEYSTDCRTDEPRRVWGVLVDTCPDCHGLGHAPLAVLGF